MDLVWVNKVTGEEVSRRIGATLTHTHRLNNSGFWVNYIMPQGQNEATEFVPEGQYLTVYNPDYTPWP
jgi:hypothetical protein